MPDNVEQPTAKKAKNSAQRSRVVTHKFSYEEESRLIAAIEKRPALWNAALPEYKVANRTELWDEVAAEIFVGGVDGTTARNKWGHLRSNFSTHIAKLRKKRSGQGVVDASAAFKYAHFKELLFVEESRVHQASPSTSTLDSDNASTDESFLNELFASTAEFEEQTLCTPTATPIVGHLPDASVVGQRRRKRTASTTPSPAPSNKSAQGVAVEILQSLHQRAEARSSDSAAVFGEFIADHVRQLDRGAAIELQSQLTTTLFDFLRSHEQTRMQSVSASVSSLMRPISAPPTSAQVIASSGNVNEMENRIASEDPFDAYLAELEDND